MEFKSAHKNLNTFIKADELVLEIYLITKGFPKDELFGLVSQMRRCAVSVPANIAEGYGRRTVKDKLQFYFISRGSLNELEYYIDLAFKLNYIKKEDFQKLIKMREIVGKLLNGLIKSLN